MVFGVPLVFLILLSAFGFEWFRSGREFRFSRD